jgi:hypothetical protein
MQHHNYSLTDLEDMLPWEREIYTSMLKEDIKHQREEAQRQRMR